MCFSTQSGKLGLSARKRNLESCIVPLGLVGQYTRIYNNIIGENQSCIFSKITDYLQTHRMHASIYLVTFCGLIKRGAVA